MTYQPPEETIFDENGEPVELGAKFYAPGDELLILLPDSTEWQLPEQIIEATPTETTRPYSDLGDDFTPVSDNDTTGFGQNRVS